LLLNDNRYALPDVLWALDGGILKTV